jgi:hypothetical protein
MGFRKRSSHPAGCVPRDEGEAWARKPKEVGVHMTAVRYDGTVHEFVLLNAASAHAVYGERDPARERIRNHKRSERRQRYGGEEYRAGNSPAVFNNRPNCAFASRRDAPCRTRDKSA